MTDLRDPVRDDLDAMFRRREGDVAGTPRLGHAARRRVRRRQGATVGASAVAAIAVVAVAASILPRTSPPAPLDTSSAPRTSTIQGATITYPGDWYVVALPQATSDWTDQQPPSAFRPVFQLSNFDPVSDAVGDDNRHWLCPIASGTFPDGGSLLYVEAIGGPIAESTDAWPVSYPQGVAGIDSGGACAGGTTVDTSWTADGVTYHGIVMGDAGDPEIQAAFESMRFAGGTPATPGFVDEGPLTSEAYVLASGESGSSAWNLIVHVDEGCLAVAWDGAQIVWECDAWDPLDGSTPFVEYRNGRVLFGPVVTDVARLEYLHDDGRIDEVEISMLPSSFGDLRAYAFQEPGVLSGALVAFDASGAMIGTALPTPTPPTDDGTVVPTPVGPLPGELARGAWMDGAWLLSSEPGALTLRDAEYGDILAIVPWAEEEEGAVAVQTVTADLEGRIETVIFGTVASDAPHLGLTGDGAIHVPVLRSALSDRAGRDYFLAIVPEASGGAVLSATADGCEDPTVSTWVARGIGPGTPFAPTDAERAAVCGLVVVDPRGETEARPRADLTSASVGGATPFEPLVIDGETVFGEAYPNGEDTCVSTWSRHWSSALCIATEELFDVAPMIYLDMIDDANTVVVAGLGPAELHAVGVPTRDGQEILLTTALGEGWGDVRYVMGIAVLLEQRVPTLTYLDADGGDLYPPGTPQGGMGMSSSSDAP